MDIRLPGAGNSAHDIENGSKKRSLHGIQRMTYRYKLIFGFGIFFLVTSLAMGSYFLAFQRSHLQQRTFVSSGINAEQFSSMLDYDLRMITRYYRANADSQEMEFLLGSEMNYSNYSEISAATQLLSGGSIVSDMVKSFTFVNFDSAWVLSSKGMYSLADLENADAVKHLYENASSNGSYVYDSAADNLSVKDPAYHDNADVGGLLYVLKLPAGTVNTNAVLIINVDISEIFRTLESRLLVDEKVCILDGAGDVIRNEDDGLTKACESIQEKTGPAAELQLSDLEQNLFGNMAYVFGRESSGVMNWVIYIGESQSKLLDDSGRLMLMAFAVLLALIAALAVALFYFAYIPVLRLRRKLAEAGFEASGEEAEPDDIRFVEREIAHLEDNRNILEEKISSQNLMLRSAFELQVLRGKMTEEQFENGLLETGLPEGKFFSAAAFSLRTASEDEYLSVVEEGRIYKDIEDHLEKSAAGMQIFAPIIYNHAIFLVIGDENDDVLMHLGIECYEKMHSYIEQTYHLKLHAGISKVHLDYHELPDAFRESMTALSDIHEDADNDGCTGDICNLYSDQVKFGTDALPYDTSYEEEMKSAILSGDKEMAYSVIGSFMRYLGKENIFREMQISLLLQMLSTINMSFMKAGLRTSELYRADITSLTTDIMQFYSIDKTRKYFKHMMLDPGFEKLEALQSSQSQTIMKRLEEMIRRKKGNVSLSECAEELGYNPTYIWKILKAEKKQSFTEYADSYKIAVACELLKTTELSVANISEELGYSNSQNFIRFFSKTMGMTPGKYRKETV